MIKRRLLRSSEQKLIYWLNSLCMFRWNFCAESTKSTPFVAKASAIILHPWIHIFCIWFFCGSISGRRVIEMTSGNAHTLPRRASPNLDFLQITQHLSKLVEKYTSNIWVSVCMSVDKFFPDDSKEEKHCLLCNLTFNFNKCFSCKFISNYETIYTQHWKLIVGSE